MRATTTLNLQKSPQQQQFSQLLQESCQRNVHSLQHHLVSNQNVTSSPFLRRWCCKLYT